MKDPGVAVVISRFGKPDPTDKEVWGLRFCALGLEFKGLGFGVSGLGFGVSGLGLREC